MEITRSWREQKIMLKWRYPSLIDQDFAFVEGNKEGMMERLAEKLKKSREELIALFAELQTY